MDAMNRTAQSIHDIRNRLISIYGNIKGEKAFHQILPVIRSIKQQRKKKEYFSQNDIVLITYGDSLKEDNTFPLKTLQNFADHYLEDTFSIIHILPFYPYSSDDGFSVMDYASVDPSLGSWDHIKKIANHFDLMVDLVANHISAKSEWFEKYLADEKGFEALAIEMDPSADVSAVTRPRALPLLTEFTKQSGETVYLWTTFSDDQIDLNYKNLDVLEKMVNVLLFYVAQGARIIRLDAIAYLWKEIGTPCIHCEQTHGIVKLFRSILDAVAPDTVLITETNVPHDENIRYFGDGTNEAQMVYNFTLPPLLLHSFLNENTHLLSRWAKGLSVPSKHTAFYNFTASHDGIGVRPLEGILNNSEIHKLSELIKKNGGGVSYKGNPDGTESPYELNITYVDALCRQEDDPYHAARFLAAQSIQYVLPGVPATYIHSLLGSRNWDEGVKRTHRLRAINREKLVYPDIINELKNPDSFRANVFYPYTDLIKLRKKQPAFHPNAGFEIVDIQKKVFAIKRFCDDQTIYALTNVSSEHLRLTLKNKTGRSMFKDIISGKEVRTDAITLGPYQYMWLVG